MEQVNMNDNGQGGNPVDREYWRQGLRENVDKELNKMSKQQRWGIILSPVLVVLFLVLIYFFPPTDWKSSCGWILVAVLFIVIGFVAISDYKLVGKIVKSTSSKEQLEGILRYKKRQRISLWVTPFLCALVILVGWLLGNPYDDKEFYILSGLPAIIGTMIGAYLGYKYSPASKRLDELEDDLRELAEMDD